MLVALALSRSPRVRSRRSTGREGVQSPPWLSLPPFEWRRLLSLHSLQAFEQQKGNFTFSLSDDLADLFNPPALERFESTNFQV